MAIYKNQRKNINAEKAIILDRLPRSLCSLAMTIGVWIAKKLRLHFGLPRKSCDLLAMTEALSY